MLLCTRCRARSAINSVSARFPLAHLSLNELKNAAMEAWFIKLECMVTDGFWIIFAFVKCSQHSRQTLHRLFIEEGTCHPIDDRGKCATSPISNHGTTRCLRLQWGNAKILFAGQQQGATVRIVIKY